MTLKPTDMLEIQSAIDEYQRKFPRRPPPSAEVALAWRLGKREARQSDADLRSGGEEKLEPEFAQQECNRLAWAWEQLRLQWQIWVAREDNDVPSDEPELLPWVK